MCTLGENWYIFLMGEKLTRDLLCKTKFCEFVCYVKEMCFIKLSKKKIFLGF